VAVQDAIVSIRAIGRRRDIADITSSPSKLVTATLREDVELFAAEQKASSSEVAVPGGLALLAVPLSQPYHWGAAVLVDELNPCAF
jgi:hypothetical protein